MPKVIGIDHSSSVIGYCVMDTQTPNEPLHLGYQTFIGDLYTKVRAQYVFVQQLYADVQPLDTVLFEAPAPNHHQGGIPVLICLGACLAALRTCSDTPIYSYPPSTLKKWFAGKGNATKEQMVAEYCRRYYPDQPYTIKVKKGKVRAFNAANTELVIEDEADAYAVAAYGVHLFTSTGNWSFSSSNSPFGGFSSSKFPLKGA